MDSDIQRFLDGLLNRSKLRLPHLFNKKNSITHNYLEVGGGKTGVEWRYEPKKDEVKVQFYLNHKDKKLNRRINEDRFKHLLKFKDEIDKAFGDQRHLDWNFKEDRKCQYIQYSCDIGGLDNEEKWPKIWQDCIDCLARLENALKYYIDKLP